MLHFTYPYLSLFVYAIYKNEDCEEIFEKKCKKTLMSARHFFLKWTILSQQSKGNSRDMQSISLSYLN